MDLRNLIFVSALLFAANTCQALSLNVVNGELFGASNIEIDGAMYDVLFTNGKCSDLYNGCNENSDFIFQNEASAAKASTSLLSTIFSSTIFDDDPELTHGCGSVELCRIWTPFAISGDWILTSTTYNHASGSIFIDGYSNSNKISPTFDLVAFETETFAVWSLATPVISPSTIFLMSVGLFGLWLSLRTGSRKSRLLMDV